MDPNQTLSRMRALAEHGVKTSNLGWADKLELCELVLALDSWLSGGGFLPGRWERHDPDPDTRP